MQDHDGFPESQFDPGRAPCGECHLQTGEVCDICGAHAAAPATPPQIEHETD